MKYPFLFSSNHFHAQIFKGVRWDTEGGKIKLDGHEGIKDLSRDR